MDESTCSSFNIERADDTQDSIDQSLISEGCSSFYERADQGYICKVCEHHYASRRYVLFHLTNSHSIPTHSWPTCNMCGKIFTKPSKLAVHILSHPKKKSKDSDTPEATLESSTPPIVAPVLAVLKQSTPERGKSKLKTVPPKLLTVYFVRSSLPDSYKQNPFKCGKCFKSFLTADSRELHREQIHATIIGSGCNNSVSSLKKAKYKRKKSIRKSIHLNTQNKFKSYRHKHISQSSIKSTLKSTHSKSSLSRSMSAPHEEAGKETGSQSKPAFSFHIESPFPNKPPANKRKSSPSSSQSVASVSTSIKRVSLSHLQDKEFNGTPRVKIKSEKRPRHSLPLPAPAPFGLDIVMDDFPSDM